MPFCYLSAQDISILTILTIRIDDFFKDMHPYILPVLNNFYLLVSERKVTLFYLWVHPFSSIPGFQDFVHHFDIYVGKMDYVYL